MINLFTIFHRCAGSSRFTPWLMGMAACTATVNKTWVLPFIIVGRIEWANSPKMAYFAYVHADCTECSQAFLTIKWKIHHAFITTAYNYLMPAKIERSQRASSSILLNADIGRERRKPFFHNPSQRTPHMHSTSARCQVTAPTDCETEMRLENCDGTRHASALCSQDRRWALSMLFVQQLSTWSCQVSIVVICTRIQFE